MTTRFLNVQFLDGTVGDYTIENDSNDVIDVHGKLTLMPALIDPHVHFRTPGAEHKENWISGAKAAIAGGVTTVFDMPNTNPATSTKERLHEKKTLIDSQLKEAGIPLRYNLYFGADQNSLDEIVKVRNEVIGIKVYMGSSTGDLLMTDPKALEQVFLLAAQNNLIVSVHAEDEAIMQKKKEHYHSEHNPSVHSKIRDRTAAITATKQAIELAIKVTAQLFILHISTKEEVEMVRQAKREGFLIYAETTPHHLFFTEEEYQKWGTCVVMNPPLRTEEDREALWEGILDGTIDTIGTDHAPHTLEEKKLPYGQAPAGVPGIETLLPLLLNAHNDGFLTMEKIIALTRRNIESIFNIETNPDIVLVDLDLEKEVTNKMLKSRSGWTPFAGRTLKGWPIYTVVRGRVFHVG